MNLRYLCWIGTENSYHRFPKTSLGFRELSIATSRAFPAELGKTLRSFLIIGGVAGIHADVQRYTWPLAFWVSFVKGAARRLSVIMLILIFKESSICRGSLTVILRFYCLPSQNLGIDALNATVKLMLLCTWSWN